MDFNIENIRMFYYPFSWKIPLIYILLFPAVGLYVYIFYIRCGGEAFGVMERSKEIKVFCVFFVTIFLFHFFRTSHFIQQIESVLLRAILLMGVVFLAMVFILPAWIFNEYDHKKMDTYARILPFQNSPYIRIKDTLVFNTIKTVNPSPGEDTGALRFILHDGQKQSLDIANVPRKSRDIFLATLYNECDWLRDDLEKQFGSIVTRKIYVDSNKEYGYINVVHVLLNTFFLWLFLAQIICLLVYTFKITIKL